MVLQKGNTSRLHAPVGGDCEHIIDGGASLYFIVRTLPTPDKRKPVKGTNNPCIIVTANGTVETKEEEATVYIKELNIFICVKL